MKWRGGRQSSNVRRPLWSFRRFRRKNNGRRWYRYDCYRSPLFLFSGGDLNSVTDIFRRADKPLIIKQKMWLQTSIQRKKNSPLSSSAIWKVWNGVLKQNRLRIKILNWFYFTGSVQSACGNATSQVGPFYCPADQNVYLDLSALQQNFLKSMGPAEILPWPMSLLMKLVITYKTNLVLHSNSIRSANRFLKRIQSI